MPIKAVFFDIDGTLVDSNEFHVRAWDEAFHDHGYEIEQAGIRGQIGKGSDQLLPTLIPGIDQSAQKTISDRQGELFRTRYLKQVRPFPRARDLIEMLHTKGTRVLLASSSDKVEVDYYVDLLKVGHALSGTVSNDDVERSKPAGDIFAAALAQVFPLGAAEAIAVGDTPFDVESALCSNIKTIGLRSGGFSEETLSGASAITIYASVKELFESFATSPLAV
jgi:phosphoglycolate phosphatase-like HAD superfamily hydrolase